MNERDFARRAAQRRENVTSGGRHERRCRRERRGLDERHGRHVRRGRHERLRRTRDEWRGRIALGDWHDSATRQP
jgi:hypothetical protein